MATPTQQVFPQGQLTLQVGGPQPQPPASSSIVTGQLAVQPAVAQGQQSFPGPTALARQGPSPLALEFLATYIANPRRTQPPPSSTKRYLKVDDEIVTSNKRRKTKSRRKNAAVYDPTKKTMLYEVPPEIVRAIFDKLDVPSRVSLSLTSKFFYEISKKVDTGVTDLPSPVRMHAKCHDMPCVYTNHLSDRRILLLMLKSWMPHGTTLCWICMKYTRTSAEKWRETNAVNLLGLNRIALPALDLLNLRKVRCHDACLPNKGRDAFYHWLRRRPGSFGGFEEISMYSAHFIPRDGAGFIEYDSGETGW
ncbi:hypothetical protein LTR84_003331 [Exophiala bonariae]|uniref:F-box domain-containing protein n=1 Tax=Exophiala bonariae TaxID=1690606 RepID=A0AAV9NBA0_9EURO|nr:hypothetical protein LTR84_003331 [Exophiala bonariae]